MILMKPHLPAGSWFCCVLFLWCLFLSANTAPPSHQTSPPVRMSSCVTAASPFASVGADRLLCVIFTAIVRFGLILEVLVHVHLVLAIHRLVVVRYVIGLQLHVVGALNDGNGRLRTGWGARALWRHLRWGCGSCHGDSSRVDHTGAGGDGDLWRLSGWEREKSHLDGLFLLRPSCLTLGRLKFGGFPQPLCKKLFESSHFDFIGDIKPKRG